MRVCSSIPSHQNSRGLNLSTVSAHLQRSTTGQRPFLPGFPEDFVLPRRATRTDVSSGREPEKDPILPGFAAILITLQTRQQGLDLQIQVESSSLCSWTGKLTESLLRACFQALGESLDLAFQSIQEILLLGKPLRQVRDMLRHPFVLSEADSQTQRLTSSCSVNLGPPMVPPKDASTPCFS
jgi:hypothetical protein